MRRTIVGLAAATMTVCAAPAMSADLPVVPYSEQGVGYQREVHTYEREYRHTPRVVVAPPVVAAPVVTETVVIPAPVIVRRPIVVQRPPVIVDYPVYAAPRVYAYGGDPARHYRHWGYGPHFYPGY
jgi:hypothetical protein